MKNPTMVARAENLDVSLNKKMSLEQVFNMLNNHLKYYKGKNDPAKIRAQLKTIREAMLDQEQDVLLFDGKTQQMIRDKVPIPRTNFIDLLMYYLFHLTEKKEPIGYPLFISGLQELGIQTGAKRRSNNNPHTMVDDVRPVSYDPVKVYNVKREQKYVKADSDSELATSSRRRSRSRSRREKSRHERRLPPYLEQHYILDQPRR